MESLGMRAFSKTLNAGGKFPNTHALELAVFFLGSILNSARAI